MKKLLKHISNNTILLNPKSFSSIEKDSLRIGNKPTNIDTIINTENRLGVKLTNDVKEFYGIRDGTSVILNQTFSGFLPINKIDWMKKIQGET